MPRRRFRWTRTRGGHERGRTQFEHIPTSIMPRESVKECALGQSPNAVDSHEWRSAVVIVRPETVIVRHRRAVRRCWAWKSRHRLGRPDIPADVRALIRTMSRANPLWGAPRIHGELLTIGIDVSQASVANYLVRPRRPPSQSWRTCLANHISTNHGRRFLRGPDGNRPAVVRLGDTRAPPTAGRACGRHRASDGRVDGATAARRLPVGPCAAVSDSRSGSRVRGCPHHRGCDGHHRRAHRTAIALAQRGDRTMHRIRASRVPRARDRLHGCGVTAADGMRRRVRRTLPHALDRWARMRRPLAESRRPATAVSWRSRRSVACTTDTNARRLTQTDPTDAASAHITRSHCAWSLQSVRHLATPTSIAHIHDRRRTRRLVRKLTGLSFQ